MTIMETLEFRFNTKPVRPAAGATLSGVVGSGNLEILVRPGNEADVCAITVKTSARGFGEIWKAVLDEFCTRHRAGGTNIAINDMGATPAVVTLRLGQALSDYTGGVQ